MNLIEFIFNPAFLKLASLLQCTTNKIVFFCFLFPQVFVSLNKQQLLHNFLHLTTGSPPETQWRRTDLPITSLKMGVLSIARTAVGGAQNTVMGILESICKYKHLLCPVLTGLTRQNISPCDCQRIFHSYCNGVTLSLLSFTQKS